MIKSILCATFFVALFFVSQGNYDFGCNHYDYSYATDVCYQPTSSVQYKYSCNSSTSINLYEYDNGDCDTQGSSPSKVTNYKRRESDVFECDSKHACDYTRVIHYSDEECMGDDFKDYEAYIIDTCIDSSYLSFLSYKYTCNGDALEQTYYAGGNCTGYKFTTKTVFDDQYNNLYSGCYQLVCGMLFLTVYFVFFLFFIFWLCFFWCVVLCFVMFSFLFFCLKRRCL